MGPHDGRIEQDLVHVGVLHGPKQALPDALLGPAPAALAHRVVLAEAGRQRPPRAAVPRHPKHGVQKQAVVFPRAPHVPFLARQMRRERRPGRITKCIQGVHEHKGICPYNLGKTATRYGWEVRNDRHRDLMLTEGDELRVLFEVKTGVSTQSICTGLGQLLLYSATTSSADLMLVLPEKLPADVADQLKRWKVQVLYYSWVDTTPRFVNLRADSD